MRIVAVGTEVEVDSEFVPEGIEPFKHSFTIETGTSLLKIVEHDNHILLGRFKRGADGILMHQGTQTIWS